MDDTDVNAAAAHVRVPRYLRNLRNTLYPADTPDLNRQQVALDIPVQLFGSSADMALRASEVIGSLIKGTAHRYASFVQYLKPLLTKVLSAKGLYPPPINTTAQYIPNGASTPANTPNEASSPAYIPIESSSPSYIPIDTFSPAYISVQESSPDAAESIPSLTLVNEIPNGARSFGAESAPSTEAPRVVRVTRAAPVLPQGVTDDTPDFNREMVMLDIPDQLFGNSFTIITNISKVFGDLMMNTARRYANFVQYFKPLLGKALTIKGLYPPPPTTAAPTTTAALNDPSESNMI